METAQATDIFRLRIMPHCGMIKFPSAKFLISSLTPECSLPNTSATDCVKLISYKLTESSARWVVKILSYRSLSTDIHSVTSENWCTVSHLFALLLLLKPHFLCGGILLFKI